MALCPFHDFMRTILNQSDAVGQTKMMTLTHDLKLKNMDLTKTDPELCIMRIRTNTNVNRRCNFTIARNARRKIEERRMTPTIRSCFKKDISLLPEFSHIEAKDPINNSKKNPPNFFQMFCQEMFVVLF